MSHINKFCNIWNIWILNIYFQILKVRWSFKCFTIQFGSSRGFWTSPVWPENYKRSHPLLQVFQTLISLRSELIAEPEIKIWYLLLSLQEKCSYHTLFLRPSKVIDLLEYSWTFPLSLSIRSAIPDPIPSNIKVCGRLEKSKTTWFLYSEPGIIWYEPETISSDGCSSVTEQRENVGSHIPAPFSNLQNSQWKKSRLYFLKNAEVQGDRIIALLFLMTMQTMDRPRAASPSGLLLRKKFHKDQFSPFFLTSTCRHWMKLSDDTATSVSRMQMVHRGFICISSSAIKVDSY